MRTRLMRLALAPVLLGGLLIPANAVAQDGEVSFPPGSRWLAFTSQASLVLMRNVRAESVGAATS